jgi:uncharacterized protein YndB with AHSA1/START domain
MTGARTITITRSYDAPVGLVFECWLKPEHLLQWYSAGGGWTTPHAHTDPRKGGKFNIGFAGPDGKTGFDFTGTYDEVTPPLPGKDGQLNFTADDGRPVWVTFSQKDGKTIITLILTLENTYPEEQQRHGWTAMLDNLNTYLERKAA